MHKKLDISMNNDDTELNEAIANETVALLFAAAPGSVSATIVISTFLATVLWQLLGDISLFFWLIVVTFINLARFVLYKYYKKRNKEINDSAFWDKLFYILLALNGLCFSVIGLFYMPDALGMHHYFPVLVLIGLATGAVATLSFSMKYITTYFILLMFPVFINEILLGTFISYSVAVLICLSLIFSLVNAKKIYQTSKENITLNFRSEKHTQQLIESRNTAITANSAKTNFISMISHELRTPLNGILGYSQLLKMSDEPSLNEEQNDQVEGILDSGRHLLGLIEELLELSKIEAHKLNVSIFDVSLTDSLIESISMLKTVASEYNIKITNNVENIYIVEADEKRLKQVFINLISNAIKYNHENGEVVIEANKLSNGNIRVTISDDGVGLTEEQTQNVFKVFTRYDNTKEGIGLGLYITLNLIELMNGSIGVESEINKGSTFWFELPLSK